MPTVAESLIARHDLPPEVPAAAMGAMSGISAGPAHPLSPSLSRMTDLLKGIRDRTSRLFGAPASTVAPTALPTPAPNLNALRTSQLEGGLDALEQRSTTLPQPVPVKPPQPVVAPTTPTGMPAFDYRSYLAQNAARTTEGKQ